MSRYSPRERLTNTTSTSVVANWFGNQFVSVPGSFESISTVTVGSGGSTSGIEFTNIPSTYTHLQIRGIARETVTAGNYTSLYIYLNGDTANNYSAHYLAGNGASASAYAWANNSGILGSFLTAADAIASNFGVFIVDILDYANTNKYKITRTLNGFDNNGTGATDFNKGAVSLSSGNWRSTNAITSIKLTGPSTLAQYSTFALYGIKGA
jgi:hypothetical protein